MTSNIVPPESTAPIIPASIPHFAECYLRLGDHSSNIWVPNYTTLGDSHGLARGIALHSKLALDIVIEACMLNEPKKGGLIDSVAGISRIRLSDLKNLYPDGHPAQSRVRPYHDRLNEIDIWEAEAVPLLLEVMGVCFSLSGKDRDTIRVSVAAARGAASDAVNASRGGRKANYAEWARAEGKSNFASFLEKGAIGRQNIRWMPKPKQAPRRRAGNPDLAMAS